MRRVKPEYANRISKFNLAGELIFQIDGKTINNAMDQLIGEFLEKGISKEIALIDPGRLRRFLRLELPVSKTTIKRTAEYLLKNKKTLERANKKEGLKIPINSVSLCNNPETLIEKYRKKKQNTKSQKS